MQSAVTVVLVVVSMSMELVMRSSFRECALGTPPLYTAGESFSAYVYMHVGRWCTNVDVVVVVRVVGGGGGGGWGLSWLLSS